MNYNMLATFGEVVSYIGYGLIAILVLLFMITVHEAGHYFAGKILGFKIDEFAIGFGPAFFKKRKKDGEVFSVRAFPVGGFCAFHGEDAEDYDPSSFNNKPPWKRIIVLLAGVTMNFISAILIIMLMFGIYGQNVIKVGDVKDGGETYYGYSLEKGDVIIKASGKNVYLATDLILALSEKNAGEKVEFTVIRGGEEINIDVILRSDGKAVNIEDLKTVSVALGTYAVDYLGEYKGATLFSSSYRFPFFKTVLRSFEYSFKLAGTVFVIIKQLLTGQLGISSMGGTVTTIAVTAEAVRTGGFRYLLYMASFMGVNLAVFNLLPFPALDGSRVVFTLIEWIRGKPINRKVEGIIHTVGIIVLICFAVFIDLQRCF